VALTFRDSLVPILSRSIVSRPAMLSHPARRETGELPVQAAMKYDTVAHQVAIALLDHIADMDADPKLDPALGRQAGVGLDYTVLHLDGTANGMTTLLNSMRTPSSVRLTTRA
jgi:hypothetical protein